MKKKTIYINFISCMQWNRSRKSGSGKFYYSNSKNSHLAIFSLKKVEIFEGTLYSYILDFIFLPVGIVVHFINSAHKGAGSLRKHILQNFNDLIDEGELWEQVPGRLFARWNRTRMNYIRVRIF